MNTNQIISVSKFLSLVLRHKPSQIGITLDEAGWVGVADLLEAMSRHGLPLLLKDLRTVVETSEKKRFAFSDDSTRIRANQGHSVEVELGYSPATPPAVLFHGTVARFLASIRATGLSKQKRHHVHLSVDEATARNVGNRRGDAVILEIDSARMSRDGLVFFLSTNGVWLTHSVPAAYIEFPPKVICDAGSFERS